MDFCIDGVRNNIVEYNAVAETEGPHNPSLNAFYFESTPLLTELGAIRDLSPESARLVYVFYCRFRSHNFTIILPLFFCPSRDLNILIYSAI